MLKMAHLGGRLQEGPNVSLTAFLPGELFDTKVAKVLVHMAGNFNQFSEKFKI